MVSSRLSTKCRILGRNSTVAAERSNQFSHFRNQRFIMKSPSRKSKEIKEGESFKTLARSRHVKSMCTISSDFRRSAIPRVCSSLERCRHFSGSSHMTLEYRCIRVHVTKAQSIHTIQVAQVSVQDIKWSILSHPPLPFPPTPREANQVPPFSPIITS